MFRFKELLERARSTSWPRIDHRRARQDADRRARARCTRGLEVVEFACGIPQLLKGEFTENVGTGIDSWSMRQPLGVCAGITPFNFPAMVPMWMFPVAIACGNTFILKPSERDPSAALLHGRAAEGGRPARRRAQRRARRQGGRRRASSTIPTSRRSASSARRRSPSTSTRPARAHGKRVQALGGAKNHMVVMPDADMDQAADALMGAAYGSAGERCMAISVAVAVGEGGRRAGRAAGAARARAEGRPGTDPDAEMGPLVTRQHLDKVRGYVDTRRRAKAPSSWSTAAA